MTPQVGGRLAPRAPAGSRRTGPEEGGDPFGQPVRSAFGQRIVTGTWDLQVGEVDARPSSRCAQALGELPGLRHRDPLVGVAVSDEQAGPDAAGEPPQITWTEVVV